MKEHLNIFVQGDVKEIDFLYYTELYAIEKDINGYIQNGSDSRVYIEAEADSELLDQLEEYIKMSPLGARVKNISSEKAPVKDFDRFKAVHNIKKKKKHRSFLKKAGLIIQKLLS